MSGMQPTPQPIPHWAEGNSELKDTFVEMLFALVVAEIAIKFSDLVTNQLTNWSSIPAYTHLAIALSLVAASWVGWKRSKAPGKRKDVTQIFSLPFVVLVLDVWLVICYFIVARGVDMTTLYYVDGEKLTVQASALNETTWVMIIFGSYAIWDLISNSIHNIFDNHWSLKRSLHDEFFDQNGWVTLVCLAISLIIWVRFRSTTNSLKVILIDISLISLIFLFRAMKQKVKFFRFALTFGTFLPLLIVFLIR